MDTNIKIDFFLALSLIYKVQSFRSSYNLTRVLAWRFDIIAIDVLVIELLEKKLLTSDENKGISQYSITETGIAYLNIHMVEGKFLLKKIFPEQSDFLIAVGI
jgi:hypothetical protein